MLNHPLSYIAIALAGFATPAFASAENAPTTLPAVQIVKRTDDMPISHLTQVSGHAAELRATFMAGDSVDQDDLSNLLEQVMVSAGRNDWFLLNLESSDGLEPQNRSIGQKEYGAGVNGKNDAWSAADPAKMTSIAQSLTDYPRLDASIPQAKRQSDLITKHAEQVRLRRSFDILKAMIQANGSMEQPQLVDRINGLLGSKKQLADDVRSRQMRLDALKSQRQAIPARGDRARDADPVIVALKKLVDLRQQKLDETSKKYESAVATHTDVLDAQAAKVEAELRLAERQAALVSPGIATSLDQIDQEMTKLSVDLAETNAKLAEIEKQLAPFDLSKATTQSVADAADALALATNDAKANELLKELQEKLNDVSREILRLEIIRIEPTSSETH